MFALLSYVKLEGIVTKKITVKDACNQFLKKYNKKDIKKEDWLFANSYKLMEILNTKERYKNVWLSNLALDTDEFGQFGALTIRTPKITYISFEGTDSAVSGWKEDFELIYKNPIKSQSKAVEYFNKNCTFFDKKIYIGGHSKGGNLAMYAYMYGKPQLKKKVLKVYNFDGPGFLDEIINTPLYEDLNKKLLTVVPKESVIGMILGHKDYIVVNSNGISILEHDAYTWECFGGFFTPTTLSKKSKKLEKNLQEYINAMTKEERKNFVETFFNIFKNTDIQNIMELRNLKMGTLLSILKELNNVPTSTKRNLVAILRMLVTGMN